MEIKDEQSLDQNTNLLPDRFETLKELELSCRKRFIPILGKEKAKFLYDFVKKLNIESEKDKINNDENKKIPLKILELGTASGYSGIILASKGAKLLSLDFDHVSVKEANENFKKFNVNAESKLRVAEDYIKELSRIKEEVESYDLIFLDFSKKKYHEVFPFCLKLLKKGGYLLADNVKSVYCMPFKHDILNSRRLKTTLYTLDDDEFSVSKKN
ncbi:MAG: methyltransferase domain-containing protein [Candidatus Woesearchaeota archaeon]|jgi:16S rRNA G966 N2-methylase RsmD